MYLERLTLILEIASQHSDVSVAELCDQAALPKATTYRLVQDLLGVGLLEQAGPGRFATGARLRRIGGSAGSDQSLLDICGPILAQAAKDHGSAFFLARLRGVSVEIIHVETPQTGVSFLHPGLGRRPLHACSCGKAIAAFSSEPGLVRALEGRLRAYTDATQTDTARITVALEETRRRGFAECVEEIERGMCSVAAPLAQHGPGTAFAVGATGSLRVFDPERRQAIGSALIEIADQVSDTLGWALVDIAQAG